MEVVKDESLRIDALAQGGIAPPALTPQELRAREQLDRIRDLQESVLAWLVDWRVEGDRKYDAEAVSEQIASLCESYAREYAATVFETVLEANIGFIVHAQGKDDQRSLIKSIAELIQRGAY